MFITKTRLIYVLNKYLFIAIYFVSVFLFFKKIFRFSKLVVLVAWIVHIIDIGLSTHLPLFASILLHSLCSLLADDMKVYVRIISENDCIKQQSEQAL